MVLPRVPPWNKLNRYYIFDQEQKEECGSGGEGARVHKHTEQTSDTNKTTRWYIRLAWLTSSQCCSPPSKIVLNTLGELSWVIHWWTLSATGD